MTFNVECQQNFPCDRVWGSASKIQSARGLPVVFKSATPKMWAHPSGKKRPPCDLRLIF